MSYDFLLGLDAFTSEILQSKVAFCTETVFLIKRHYYKLVNDIIGMTYKTADFKFRFVYK
jgi:hypothetical protein